AYSHDEVVHGKASLAGKMAGGYDDKFASLRVLFAWVFAHPGKKLMFMGDEFAQFIEWDYKKELDWMLLEYEKHAGVKHWVAALNTAYAKRPPLYAADCGWDGFTWLNVEDRKNSVFAFMRIAPAASASASGQAGQAGQGAASGGGGGASAAGNKSSMVCVFNFTPVRHEVYDIALLEAGTLTLVLNSDDTTFGGDGSKVKKRVTAKPKPLNGLSHSATLSLPPMSALYYVVKS
ncbi:MAG: alpha amylase C-terminal domain-containing protein, partial [Clostridiales Family XIII bacterium]|nr:alpha amylase C-terminal domain-containing protein [Clostridiales Family XIII bacterium]